MGIFPKFRGENKKCLKPPGVNESDFSRAFSEQEVRWLCVFSDRRLNKYPFLKLFTFLFLARWWIFFKVSRFTSPKPNINQGTTNWRQAPNCSLHIHQESFWHVCHHGLFRSSTDSLRSLFSRPPRMDTWAVSCWIASHDCHGKKVNLMASRFEFGLPKLQPKKFITYPGG